VIYFGQYLINSSSHKHSHKIKTDSNGIIPVIKQIQNIPLQKIFQKISDDGKKKHSILLESAKFDSYSGNKSICSADPCLNIVGKKQEFEINALNKIGKEFIEELEKDFDFCKEIDFCKKKIKGTIKNSGNSDVSEKERLKKVTQFDVLRKIVFKFNAPQIHITPYVGLFGAISYDFIDQFEKLPKNKKNELKEPLYEMNFYDSLFFADHLNSKTYLIENALPFKNNAKEQTENCIKRIEKKEKKIKNTKLKTHKKNKIISEFVSDTSKKEFEKKVNLIKKHIVNGSIFQAVISRTISTKLNNNPLKIYEELYRLNPSPYMFYFHNSDGVLLGSSPETFLRVQNVEGKKLVQIKPIAGTKPRGIKEKKIDYDFDSKLETELKMDKKELAEHAMLLDLSRNDIAKISEKGSRKVISPFSIEKYSYVQHLVSTVQGNLKKDLDAFHAYLACMNMGTLSGAPKVEAMKLIRKYEKNERGFYGGAIGYITPNDEMDSAIIIRAVRIKNKKAFVRTGAGIVFDSDPEKEFFETEKKALACIKAINAGAD